MYNWIYNNDDNIPTCVLLFSHLQLHVEFDLELTSSNVVRTKGFHFFVFFWRENVANVRKQVSDVNCLLSNHCRPSRKRWQSHILVAQIDVLRTYIHMWDQSHILVA
jgi:hypothetical protein